MRDRLLPLLLLLTLLDLGFVQATGIVGGSGLVPLWLLTLAAPGLRRLQRRVWCRVTWNLGVLVVFALLVRHATTTGLLHMLEDGLVLAVLYQVHLLNNIGERQRPDLVFFNSLLIAFVTSFFAPDLAWSLLFVAHALVLVAALQVNVLVRRGGPVAGAAVRQVVRHAAVHSVAIGAVTAVLFVLLPRDFARQGWIGDALGRQDLDQAGLAERIRLDDEQPVRLADTLIAQIRCDDGAAAVPSHWRAIAFAMFDGRTWYPQEAEQLGSRFATDPAWIMQPDGRWARTGTEADGAAGRTRQLHVRLHDLRSARLPLPLTAVQLQPRTAGGALLDSRSFGGFVVLPLDDTLAPPFEYDVGTAASPRSVRVDARTRRHFLALPDRGVPEVARALARQLRSADPDRTEAAAVAAATADWLRDNRRYALPGEPGFARNLGEFLVGSGAGHCEYFATALAMLLRLQEVPCRVVGGWLAHEVDPGTDTVIVRSRDAHAWVEALGADGAWLQLDATPAADVLAGRSEAPTWLSGMWRDLESLWGTVVGFDGSRRAAWLQHLRDLPATLFGALRTHAVATLALLALVAWVVYRRRRRQDEPAIVALERAVRAAGLSLQDGETPRELLLRAETAGVAAAPLAGLRQAALHHERLRYGPAAARPGQGVPSP